MSTPEMTPDNGSQQSKKPKEEPSTPEAGPVNGRQQPKYIRQEDGYQMCMVSLQSHSHRARPNNTSAW